MKRVAVNIDNTIEDLAQLMIDNKVTLVTLQKEIRNNSFSNVDIQVLLQRLDVANKRIHEGLQLNEILFYALIPSRKLHGFSKKYHFNTDKAIKQGFKRKVNQYYGFSVLGHFLYIIIALVLIFKNM